jgi:putative sterol carrier protein
MSARFREFFLRLREDPGAASAAKKSGAVVQFRLLAPPSIIVLELAKEPFAVSDAEHPSPDVEITLTVAAAEQILSGKLSVGQAAATQAARVRGGFFKLLGLQSFFEAARSAWPPGA